ncbi:MAG: hypothetical protein KC609_02170 [Myxococcales bacterium]|nr:hypothetical protein [Myxococcales bacterium]
MNDTQSDRRPWLQIAVLGAALACGIVAMGCAKKSSATVFAKSDGYTGYTTLPDQSTVITGVGIFVGPSDIVNDGTETCIELAGVDQCVTQPTGKFCSQEGAKADLIVVDGVVVDVVCYPPPTPANTTTVVPDNGNVDVPQNANNTVIVFDSSTDGEPIKGNITVDGNNVAIYGNGPDKTIIEGDLHIDGNNARVRGVTVTGNVTWGLNGGALLFSVVQGNVTVDKNNIIVSAVDVWGNVTVSGNNAILVANRVAGNWQITGNGEFCDGNYAFVDDNQDNKIQSTEIGDLLTCN